MWIRIFSAKACWDKPEPCKFTDTLTDLYKNIIHRLHLTLECRLKIVKRICCNKSHVRRFDTMYQPVEYCIQLGIGEMLMPHVHRKLASQTDGAHGNTIVENAEKFVSPKRRLAAGGRAGNTARESPVRRRRWPASRPDTCCRRLWGCWRANCNERCIREPP